MKVFEIIMKDLPLGLRTNSNLSSNILQIFENIKSNLLFIIFDQIQMLSTFDVYLIDRFETYFNQDLRH